jgi:Na+-transporting NADH:ubiquinone oxidoreductase subunit B
VAPHARAPVSLAGIQTIRLLALAPVLIGAVINTGHQYLSALNAIGNMDKGDCRDRMVQGLGLNPSDPAMFDVLAAGLVHLLPVLAMALLVGGVWEQLFATYRRRKRESGLLLIAVLMTLLMPPGVSLAHLAIGMSFAMVFARGIFGGEGKTFVNPAVVGAAFMLISFPTALTGHPLWSGIAGYGGTRAFALYDSEGKDALASAGVDWWAAFFGNLQGMMGTTSLLAIGLGGALLIVTGIASWRLIVAQFCGLVLAVILCNVFGDEQGIATLAVHWHVVLGGFAFGAVFMATDPVSASQTNAGKWVFGILIGFMTWLIRVVNPAFPEGIMLAILFANIFAPVIDYFVVQANVRRRLKRHA